MLLENKEETKGRGATREKGVRGEGGAAAKGGGMLEKLVLLLENQVLEEKDLLPYAENHFVGMMNLGARELGLLHSRFSNPTGLANKQNVSTAYDIAKLCVYGLRNPVFHIIVNTQQHIATSINKFQTKKPLKIEEKDIMKPKNGVIQKNEDTYSLSKRSLFLENTNKLLKKGFTGVKTGITDPAGPCLAVAYKDVVCVILKCRSMERRWEEVEGIVRWKEEGRMGGREEEGERMGGERENGGMRVDKGVRKDKLCSVWC